jgi:type II secretory pathway predicted ATPase ExeA
MYNDYWKLHKSPFDNVPDPSMYVDCHVSMENVIAETIFAIKEANECFAVIIGDIGLGKTLSLRIIIDSLEPEKYKVALVTNPSIPFVQLLREIIGQITGKQCEEKTKVDLLEIFNHLLFQVINQGMKVVIFIDEANSISPANLENLRLLTNMQDDRSNLFTLVLAGQMELARRLEHPKRSNLFQRIGTYGRIDKLPSEEAVKTYIETRLKLAGSKTKIFSDESIGVIWEYSDGIPRLINKICKLCLKAGETNEFRIISPEVATQVAERFQKLSNAALQKRKPRNRPNLVELTEEEIEGIDDLQDFYEPITTQETESKFSTAAEQLQETPKTISSQKTVTKAPISTEDLKDGSKFISHQESPQKLPDYKIDVSTSSLNKPIHTDSQENEVEEYEEVQIGSHKIKLTILKHIIKQAASADHESATKLAGYLAAQIIKDNPHLVNSSLVDPVSIWHEIKDFILKKFEQHLDVKNTMKSS